ncbi:putative scavenger receptor cysteine-rich type 1 protein M130-like [Scophthalmus maximus]|uniref:Putative scavenger receptor cysteine-rich type 1 protein M130-like n=1 Tax=Scophthalmus maximus TaxID=52904 RepID=A0A2U9CSP2_SCOMX|nr:putative scavenger receptor cysteine-rich type 1 protein M130-like [Scophthalmus maximus]
MERWDVGQEIIHEKVVKLHLSVFTDLLVQPNIFVSPIVGVSMAKKKGFHVLLGSSFSVTRSTEPQYQGGSFHLLFTTSDTAQNYTLPAVDHSAHFLFSAARSAHRGDYTRVYHVYIFTYNFSSESRPLHLIVSASVTELIIRCTAGSDGVDRNPLLPLQGDRHPPSVDSSVRVEQLNSR